MKTLVLHYPHETEFLKSFHTPWLKQSHVQMLEFQHPLHPAYLYGIKNASYDCLLVSPEMVNFISRPTLANWFRVLKPNGKLILSRTPKNNTLIQSGLTYCSPIVSHVDDFSPHFIQVHKKAHLPALSDMLWQSFETQKHQKHAESIAFLQNMLLFFPDEFVVYQYLLYYYERMGWKEQAVELLDVLVNHQFANYHTAQLFRVVAHLQSGDYAKGFQIRNEYCQQYMDKHRRCHAYPAPPDSLDEKYWQGEDLHGKTFVVWSEFGLGDEIMFAQLAHYLKHVVQVGKLIWVVQPPILSLVQTHPDIDEVVSAKIAADTLHDLDFWAFPHDLLVHFNKQPFAQMPKRMPYLHALPENKARFAALTQSPKKRKIGLAWRGDPSHENDKYRSIHNVNLLNTLLDTSPDIQFYCVQKEINEAERAWLAENHIPHLGDELRDFADTAALLANLDLLITVDTSVAHVAGATNMPMFVLLPYVYDWRWGVPQAQNMWYPNARKFQISHPRGSWDEVLLNVKNTLQEMMKN